VHNSLDDDAMRQAASFLIGSHNFTSFEGTLTDNEDPICHLQQLSLTQQGDTFLIHAYADRFLKHMVRTIVGTLVEVGRAQRTPRSMAEVLAAKDRTAAGRTAPASGLFLVRVDYNPSTLSPTDGL
jgi:tRNA pseudouridine38-40 synthase